MYSGGRGRVLSRISIRKTDTERRSAEPCLFLLVTLPIPPAAVRLWISGDSSCMPESEIAADQPGRNPIVHGISDGHVLRMSVKQQHVVGAPMTL